MKDYIVGIGEVLWDLLPSGPRLGGAPANFAYHVSQFGLNGMAVSAIGQDTRGDKTITSLDAHNLNYHLDRIKEPTGEVKVTLDDKGEPQYEIMTGVAWDNIPFTKELSDIAAETKAVCFGSLAQRSSVSRKTIEAFLDAVKPDCLKIFDINLRQSFYNREVLENSFKRADILKINENEILEVSRLFAIPGKSYSEICKTLIERFCFKMVILTCGETGSYVFYDGGVSYLDTPKVDVKDLVGAGDSFTGAFVACILKGMPVDKAHKIAVNVSAYVCTQDGAMPVIPESVKML